ncbi:MAG: ABC transporter substrate-binding protein [Promethearchaeota archaeon]
MEKKNIFIIILICIVIASIPIILLVVNIVTEDDGEGEVNHAPVINSYYPLVDPSINETETQEFNISATDPDGDPLTYGWYLNGTKVGGNYPNYIFDANYNPYSIYTVKVNVTDGDQVASRSWTLTVNIIWSAEDCPGAPEDITRDQIIKVGIIGDTERTMGEGALQGALLAAEEINEAGGIVMNDTAYYIGIVSENTDEANPILDTSKAVIAANKLINYYKVDYAAGSFRTEAALAYQPLFAEKKIVFWNTGAASPVLTHNVLDDHDTYKYYFQPSPQNVSGLADNIIKLILGTAFFNSLPVEMGGLGFPILNFSFMREDLAWTGDFAEAMIDSLTSNTLWNMTYTGFDLAVPLDITVVQMEAYWDAIDDARTQIVIPIFSGGTGLTFCQSYASKQPKCLPIGINVVTQDGDFWEDSDGTCEYGVGLEAIFETNKTVKTLDFWSAYEDAYDELPVYTAVGTYDSIYQLAWALEETQSMDPDDIVDVLEGLSSTNYLVGAGGWVYYDNSHCTWLGWPFSTALAIQWYDGSKQLVPGDLLYPSGGFMWPYALLNMQPLVLPSWKIWGQP